MEDKEKETHYHAERCPVCNGFGTLKHGTKICQGCEGKGYVIVPNQMDGVKYGTPE